MPRVVSRENERLREAARLIASSRDRRKSGRCVLEGAHLIDVYCARVGVPETLIVVDERAPSDDIARLVAQVPASRVLVVTRALFAEVATLPPDVGALAVVDTPCAGAATQGEFCVLLEDLQDPGNVGSIIRTAAAAGVAQVLLSRHCAFAWSPKALRAGQGAHFLTTIVEDVDLAAWVASFRARGGLVAAMVAHHGADLYATALPRPLAIAVGNEGS